MDFVKDYRFGAHLSIAGGYDQALTRAKNIGANCLQIFSSPPRNWSIKSPARQEIDLFLRTKKQLGIEPIYFHTTYLINLASQEAVGKKSVEFLIKELNLAEKLEIKGSIVHLGSYKEEKTPAKYKLLIKNIQTILNKTPEKTLFIIENAGNRKIGADLDEISQIVNDLNNKRIRVCLDSCHLWSTGNDLSDNSKLEKFLKIFDRKIGLDRLELWH
ncbi:MAG: deoxyribonuclease IV, partial [Patescibacteria group bacterium]